MDDDGQAQLQVQYQMQHQVQHQAQHQVQHQAQSSRRSLFWAIVTSLDLLCVPQHDDLPFWLLLQNLTGRAHIYIYIYINIFIIIYHVSWCHVCSIVDSEHRPFSNDFVMSFGYVRESIHSVVKIETGSVYGAAILLPQLARTLGWPRELVVLAFQSWVYLFLCIIVHGWLLMFIAKEENVMEIPLS